MNTLFTGWNALGYQPGLRKSRWDLVASSTHFAARRPPPDPAAVLAAAANFILARLEDSELHQVALRGVVAGFVVHQRDHMDGFPATSDTDRTPVDATALLRVAMCS